MKERTVTVGNKAGLHARPAGLFVETASRFRAAILVAKGEQEVIGNSVLALMLLEITPGCQITIKAEGEDEEQAVEALADLVARGFGE